MNEPNSADSAADSPPPTEYSQGGGSKSGAKTGCIIVASGCLIMMLVLAGIAIYVAMNWQNFATDMVSSGLKYTVNQSELPEDQKERIGSTIERVATDFKEGKIDGERLESVFDTVGPLLGAIVGVTAVNTKIEQSGLSEEEKTDARMTIRRMVTGLLEEKIPASELQKLQKIFEDEQGVVDPDRELTDDQLREAIAAADQAADNSGIPDEVPEPDVATAFEEAVQRAYED